MILSESFPVTNKKRLEQKFPGFTFFRNAIFKVNEIVLVDPRRTTVGTKVGTSGNKNIRPQEQKESPPGTKVGTNVGTKVGTKMGTKIIGHRNKNNRPPEQT